LSTKTRTVVSAKTQKTPKRPRAEPLSRERILEMGMVMIASGGVDALSMRALAAAMETSPMSLYRHVSNKDDLLVGIASLALDQLELDIPSTGDWTFRAVEWMTVMRRQLRNHPSALPSLMQHGQYAPAYLRATNVLLQILLEAGFRGRAAVKACREITWAMMGFLSAEIRSPDKATLNHPSESGPSPYARLDELPPEARAQIAPLIPYFLERDMDELFRDSAEHLLEGLAAELARSPGDTDGG
jgi:AcrR family transcriptional regulator